MICVFGYQHVCQQTRGGQPFVDDVSRHRCLHQRVALAACPFATDVALHPSHARYVIKLLCDILTNTGTLAATGACGVMGLVMDIDTWQLWWQSAALGLPARRG